MKNLSRNSFEALKSAESLSKQIMTLSTGIIVLSATFLKDFFSKPIHLEILGASWIFLSISIILGLLSLGAIIDNMNRHKYDIHEGHARKMTLIQEIAFFLGIIGFWVFALLNMNLIQVPV
ncbi:MAG: hypothetical protein WC613_03275 [Candidatus Aenigmatarchaeota archaeon]